MPDELTLNLDDLKLVVVEPPDDLRFPVLAERRQLVGETDLVDRHAQNCPILISHRASAFPLAAPGPARFSGARTVAAEPGR